MKLQVIDGNLYFGGNGYKKGDVLEVNDLIGNELLSKKTNIRLFTKPKKLDPKTKIINKIKKTNPKPQNKIKNKKE